MKLSCFRWSFSSPKPHSRSERNIPLSPSSIPTLLLFLLTTTFSLAAPFTSVTFPASDGLLISADYYRVDDDPSRPIIVCFHQASWSRGEYRETAPRLNGLGFNCVAIDQRSGDQINGVINETKQRAANQGLGTAFLDAIPDMEAAIKWTKVQHPGATVIAIGSSYSSALILKLAGEQPTLVDAVLSFSPGEYFSPGNLVRTGATGLNKPVFITSARNEVANWTPIYDVIPSAEKTSFTPTTAGNHGSRALWPQFSDSESYWTAVEAFLDRWIPVPKLQIMLPGDSIPSLILQPTTKAPSIIEASVDLKKWISIAPFTEDVTLAENPTIAPQRFFRLRESNETGVANILSVSASGSPGDYTFSVQIVSPDLGCGQYADWWEILDEDGNLLYRRVLTHSHTTEQPFTRTGGPVDIQADQTVWIRAHMNNTGFGGRSFHGNAATIFRPRTLPAIFAPWTSTLQPLPTNCAF